MLNENNENDDPEKIYKITKILNQFKFLIKKINFYINYKVLNIIIFN